jgi:AcrR family transcriptional regulator
MIGVVPFGCKIRNDPYHPVMRGAAKRPYRRAEETRRRVLDVADRLFYAAGIRAVGIDRLATEAGITTATLYRLFGSKDGLITAYFRGRGAAWVRPAGTRCSARWAGQFLRRVPRQSDQADSGRFLNVRQFRLGVCRPGDADHLMRRVPCEGGRITRRHPQTANTREALGLRLRRRRLPQRWTRVL